MTVPQNYICISMPQKSKHAQLQCFHCSSVSCSCIPRTGSEPSTGVVVSLVIQFDEICQCAIVLHKSCIVVTSICCSVLNSFPLLPFNIGQLLLCGGKCVLLETLGAGVQKTCLACLRTTHKFKTILQFAKLDVKNRRRSN